MTTLGSYLTGELISDVTWKVPIGDAEWDLDYRTSYRAIPNAIRSAPYTFMCLLHLITYFISFKPPFQIRNV